jgi:hypothetical protein
MSALAASDRVHLAKLLGMLGSDHLVEVANAGRLADQLVRAAGLTWPDVITPTHPPPDADPDTDLIGADWPARGSRMQPISASAQSLGGRVPGRAAEIPAPVRKQRSILAKIVVRLRACGCAI